MFKKNDDDDYWSGFVQRHFDLGDLALLIEPQYRGIEGLSIWIYARYFSYETLKTAEPEYDQPVYSSTNVQLTENVFDELIQGILVPEVVDGPEGAENMVFYSQSVPATLPLKEDGQPDRSYINLYLIFAIQKSETYAEPYTKEILINFQKFFDQTLVIVSAGFCGVLVVILLDTLRTSRRIIRTIEVIKDITNTLTTKTDLEAKRHVIYECSQKEPFSKIARQYSKMQQAKEILKTRQLER